jgi:hypothetical protein
MDATPELDPDLLDKVTNLAKRRGFIFQSAEIYGGFRSTYDYGPLGVNMLRNVKNAWWRAMVQTRHDIVGLDAAIMGPPRDLHGPARGLSRVQGTLARRQDRRGLSELWFDEVHQSSSL